MMNTVLNREIRMSGRCLPACAFVFLASMPLQAADLVLDGDVVIEVPAGETVSYGILGGTGHGIVKRGDGALRFTAVTNSTVEVTVEGGTFAVDAPVAPWADGAAWVHFDASADGAFEVAEEGGVRYVTRWNDISGNNRDASLSATTVSWMPPAEERRPWVIENGPEGLPAVDFGKFRIQSYTNSAGVALGYGGALDLSERCTAAKDIFIVGRDDISLKAAGMPNTDRPPPFVGDIAGDTYHFLRGNYSDLYPYMVLNNPNALANNGKMFIDGNDLSPTKTMWPEGYHILNFAHDTGLTVGALARDRDSSFGGKQLCEVIVFTEKLSDENRQSMNSYLFGKWFAKNIGSLTLAAGTKVVLGEGVRLNVGKVVLDGDAELSGGGELTAGSVDDGSYTLEVRSSGAVGLNGDFGSLRFPNGAELDVAADRFIQSASWGGVFRKTGAGELTVADVGEASGIEIASGSMVVDPLTTRTSFFHVDADNSASLLKSAEDGVVYVDRIDDVSGNGLYATNAATAETWRRSAEDRRVILREHAFDGRSYLDFGSLQVSTYVDSSGNGLGYGGCMTWSARATDIREMMIVAADTDDVKDLLKNNSYVGSAYASQFVGDTPYNTYHFLRGQLKSDGTCPNILMGNPNVKAHKAEIEIDGTPVSANANGYRIAEYPAGFHLCSYAFGQSESICGGTFALDRTHASGGVKLAEVLVFTNALSETVRERIKSSLMVKWLGSGDYQTYSVQTVAVAEGASLRFPHAALEVTELLDAGGELECGRLVLGTGTEVRVELTTEDIAAGKRLLVRADSVGGDVSGCVLTGADAARCRLRVAAEGLEVFVRRGTVIAVR